MAKPGSLSVSAALAAASLLAGCAGSRAFPNPTAKHVEYAERGGYPATLPSLKNGRRLYVNRCSSCHDPHKPSAYPPGDWPRIVQDMVGNAELNEVQLVDITRYLVAMSLAVQEGAAPRPMGTPTAPAPTAAPAARTTPRGQGAPAAVDSSGFAVPPAP